MSFGTGIGKSTGGFSQQIEKLRQALEQADAVLIGAGAGLSAAAGYQYDGERFRNYFADFEAQYHFHDMYTGGFCEFSSPEEQWAYWSRFIFLNRYQDPPKPVYPQLRQLVQGKEYFVLTTNVDHCFQKAGFDKQRLFYTQGDYGLWQCATPCHPKTYDNETVVREMLCAQGFIVGERILIIPSGSEPKMEVPSELVPHCPICGAPMRMNLRADDTFVEDSGWHQAAGRYDEFVRCNQRKNLLLLELGVGWNTPGIVKYTFWQMTIQNPKAIYVCLNLTDAVCPESIAPKSVCIRQDISKVLTELLV